MAPLSLIFGAVVGLSLGLTGGGGAIFAVPLLVYGLNLNPREAVAISLAAVGATSFIGFLHRWKLGEVELRTGLLFAIAGMVGAPLGTWIASRIPEAILLLAFGGLMVIVAMRLWQQASHPVLPPAVCPVPDQEDGPTCRRDATGALILTSRCTVLLLIVGVLTGILSGLFGVGGGFVIVPALVLFSGMSIHRAVGTSLMVIALVSVSGVAAQAWAGRVIDPVVTALFVAGGIAGLFAGQRIGRRLSGPMLQKVFVIAILAVAAFVILRNLIA
ncbi:sulfite exporter TauE/SafE family protein [Schlesneria sp.]|uniref:sulfite exporter TauE/SafE family protein n=1 Tax=Schlesneria sp. TaxID=2762018 RepID=UPI002EF32F65